MSFDPTSIVSIVQNCKKLHDYFADVKHSCGQRRRLLDEVHSLQPELEALQRLANTPGIVGDQASMERLGKLLDPSQPFAKAVDESLGRIKDVLTYGTSDPKANRFKVLGKRGVAALRWPVDKVEVQDLLLDLERYKSQITLAVQHDMFKKQDVMEGKLDNMDHHTSHEDRLKIAQFVSKNDYTADRRQLLEKKLSGTGTWMIDHPTFVVWRDNRESANTLWCYGHPGAGKSVMAALIIDHLQSTPGNIVLSVFCRYSSKIFTTPSAVLRGLLRQLLEKTTKVPRAICDLYWSKTDPNPDTLPEFLAEIAVSHYRPIFIVIDALDECPFGSDLLRVLQHLDSSFRVLVTSRPVFAEIKKHPSIKIRASDKDILIAVETTLSKLKYAWLGEALKDTIRAQVVDKADGMFLLASLQLRELEHDVTCRGDVLNILASLPRTLDDAYKATFQRIRGQGERKNKLACRALALVSLNSPFLDVESMQHLLAEGDPTEYANIDTILQCSCGLVQMFSPTDTLSFIHYSVYEYTTTHWPELFPEHPDRIDVYLQLGYSTLTSNNTNFLWNLTCWRHVVWEMRKPEELEQVISLLSTPAARAAFVAWNDELTCFVHDPLLIACYLWYEHVLEYMIQTASPDVQRFDEVLRICRSRHPFRVRTCIEYINGRRDMRVNGDEVVVAVDPDEDGERSSFGEFEDDETSSDSSW